MFDLMLATNHGKNISDGKLSSTSKVACNEMSMYVRDEKKYFVAANSVFSHSDNRISYP